METFNDTERFWLARACRYEGRGMLARAITVGERAEIVTELLGKTARRYFDLAERLDPEAVSPPPIPPVDDFGHDYPCPEDPDGLHFVGCGCEA